MLTKLRACDNYVKRLGDGTVNFDMR